MCQQFFVDFIYSQGYAYDMEQKNPVGRPRGARYDRRRMCCISTAVDEKLATLAQRFNMPVSELLRMAIDDLVTGKFLPSQALKRPV